MPHGGASDDSVPGVKERQVLCWTCRAVILVPLMPDGNEAPVYKCGWCGAINPQVRNDVSRAHAIGTNENRATSKCEKLLDDMEETLQKVFCCECGEAVCQFIGALIVVLTSGLIGTIGVLGVFPVLRDLTTSSLSFAAHTFIAIILEGNIFFNYYGAVLSRAGAVEDFYDLEEVPPARNSFDDFTYCSKGNLRYFLLFLFWTTVAMLYSIPMLGLSIMKHKDSILQTLIFATWRRKGKRATLSQRMLNMTAAILQIPRTPFISLLLFALCTLVLLMVGMLCARHWYLAIQGSTYVGRLKGERVSKGGMISNLSYVFGRRHPATWLLPSFEVAGIKKKL